MKKKNLAFTLAEVLIVIGIIGVVAALTLPNLNHATGDKEKVTKVKKIYSTLTEAFDRAQVIYGDYDKWFDGLATQAEKNERAAKRITEFMKISTDCGINEGCFSSAPLIYSNGEENLENYLYDLQFNGSYMVTLSDGISLAFQSFQQQNYVPRIRIDIDGPNKGKNKYGDDVFEFFINVNDNRLNYYNLLPGRDPYAESFSITYRANNATAWVIENGNLDYLKCPDELNWETKTSCE